MKKSIIFLIALVTVGVVLYSCKENPYVDFPGNSHEQPQYIEPFWDTDTTGLNAPADAINIDEAIEICNALDNNRGATTEKYKIYGLVQSIDIDNTKEGYAGFSLVSGPDKIGTSDYLIACQVRVNANTAMSETEVAAYKGHYVVIEARLQNFYGTPETYYREGIILSSTYVDPSMVTEGDGTKENPLTIADVLKLAGRKSGNFYIKGVIVGVVLNNPTTATQSDIVLEPNSSGIFRTSTNLLLGANANTADISEMVVIELSKQKNENIWNTLKLSDAANVTANLHKEVIIYGSLGTYLGMNGVINVSEVIK